MLASACSCWSPRRSSSWPLPSCCAASASAAKATTTRCRPKDAGRVGAQSRSEDGPSLSLFFFAFLSFSPLFLRSLPPTSFERFIFFGLSLHRPRLLRDPSLCMREAWEKRQRPASWPDKRCGRGVKGSEKVRLDAVDRRVHVLGDLI